MLLLPIQGQISISKSDSLRCLQWADSMLNTLSQKEKIAQLLCIRAYSNQTEAEYQQIDQLIEKNGVGGICFFKGNSEKQIELTNRWQMLSNIPLFITIDGETGVGMRLTDVEKFPTMMTMGAVSNDSLIYNIGREIGKQCRAMGIQINFAPDVDVNTNFLNPVIGTRSFGENKIKVAKKAIAYFKGLQQSGVIGVAKHFPGHGDTKKDSHYQLPTIHHNRSRLDSIELYPFQKAIEEGILGIMVGHLNVPSLDNNNIAASVSKTIITDLLQKELNFRGLVISDGLDMQGITNSTIEGETELKAFLAGNDILLLPRNPIAAINTIHDAIESGKIDRKTLNERCRKVLFFKILNGINSYNYIDNQAAQKVLHSKKAQEVTKKIFENAITLLINNQKAIPLNMRLSGKTSIIVYGNDNSGFSTMMQNFAPFQIIQYNQISNDTLFDTDSIVIAAVFAGTSKTGKYGIENSYLTHIQKLSKHKKVILCLFANPYSLSLFKDFSLSGLLLGYENQPYAGDALAQILCGKLSVKGKLPISAGNFKEDDGIIIHQHCSLCFVSPESLNVDDKYISIIDSIAQSGIDSGAYPGCQILIAKNGKVFYNKSFGFFTYEKTRKVTNGDLYDIASLTKIMATTPAIMLLNEQKIIDIDQKLGIYLPYLTATNKEKLIIRDVLAHQARLCSWIPIYKKIETTTHPKKYIFSQTPDSLHSIKIADHFYMRPEYIDTVFSLITNSDLLPIKRYLYSDLGMILLGDAIERTTKQPFNTFVSEHFYDVMNLATIGFKPLERFTKNVIVPTENDTAWRNQLLQGDVHDMTAAMLDGVAGNAGLFSNAWDVAAMMQMYLQKGFFNDKQVLQEYSIQEFTSPQFPLDNNRRGLGFDKPLISYSNNGTACESASSKSFGHSGFTGCYAWADPENELIYVFLSNRIHPTSNNTKISKMNIRTAIHQAAYNAFKK